MPVEPQRNDGRHNRKLSGFLIRPKEQLSYAFVFFGCGLSVMVAYVVFIFAHIGDTVTNIAAMYSVHQDVVEAITSSIYYASVATVGIAAAILIVMLAVGIALTHRIFGPMVSIRRQISDLKAGNYAARGHLRKKDEFHDVMGALNELAAELEKRHSGAVEKSN